MDKTIKLDNICVEIDTTPTTVKNWYKWMNANDQALIPKDLKLPEYSYGPKGVWLFDDEAVDLLRDFKQKVNGKYRGIMAKFNTRFWGEYGRERMKKNGE